MHKQIAAVALIGLSACATGSAVLPPIAMLAPPSSGDATVDGLIALNALCSAEALGVDKVAPDIKYSVGMGTGGFKVDTTNPEAQKWFDYGLALSHAFYHQDAKAVPIVEAMVCQVLADALVEKLGGDSIGEMMPRFDALRRMRLSDLPMDNTPWRFNYE